MEWWSVRFRLIPVVVVVVERDEVVKWDDCDDNEVVGSDDDEDEEDDIVDVEVFVEFFGLECLFEEDLSMVIKQINK